MKRTLFTLLISAAIVLLLLWRVETLDWQDYRPQLANEISTALNAEVQINGRLSIRFLPTPSLAAEEATLTAPGVAIKAPSLRLVLELWPLLRGNIILRRAEVEQPDIRLAPANWENSPVMPPDAGLMPASVQLENVAIRHGRLRLTLGDRTETFDELYVDLRAPDWQGPYQVAGDFVWRDIFWEFDALLGIKTAMGSRPLQFQVRQTETGAALGWQGGVVPVPLTLRGAMENYAMHDPSDASPDHASYDLCKAQPLVDLVQCFLLPPRQQAP